MKFFSRRHDNKRMAIIQDRKFVQDTEYVSHTGQLSSSDEIAAGEAIYAVGIDLSVAITRERTLSRHTAIHSQREHFVFDRRRMRAPACDTSSERPLRGSAPSCLLYQLNYWMEKAARIILNGIVGQKTRLPRSMGKRLLQRSRRPGHEKATTPM